MILKFKEVSQNLIVSMAGELDHHSSEIVRSKIDNKIDEIGSKNIIFDFSKVNFMDSSGIGVIIGRYRKVSAYGGRTVITNVKPEIKRVFELGGLFNIVKSYETVEQAIAASRENER